MTEQHPNPNIQPAEDMDTVLQDSAMHLPQEAFETEIARSTKDLTEYIGQAAVIYSKDIPIINERITQIAETVKDNPERVAADITKPPQKRTEYDVERAHLKALAIDGNMTHLAAYDRRREAGKRLLPGQKTKSEQHMLGAKVGETLAENVYAKDPVHAGPRMVESCRLGAIKEGYKVHKLSKGAKLPKPQGLPKLRITSAPY